MKKTFLLLVILVSCMLLQGQVGIGTIRPDSSAKLDVVSTSQGVLFPRMTTSQRSGIKNPALGLMVFQIDGTVGLYFFDGNNWINLVNGYPANANGYAYSTSYGVTLTLAGSGASGSTDSTGMDASFNVPTGVAVDASGNVYVADQNNHKIRKVTPAGVVSTFAGSGTQGSADSTSTAASFSLPSGVAVDAGGNVYVADEFNNKIRKITPTGKVITLAGSGATGSTDATGTAASFNYPTGVAVDAGGAVYVADQSNHKIRKITTTGMVSTLAGSGVQGSTDGAGTAASFSFPTGVAVDAGGNVYVADQGIHKIRKITPAGVVSTFAGSGALGSTDATGTAASFTLPSGVAVDASGNVYVASQFNNKIRRITPAGVATTLSGSGATGSNDGSGTSSSFNLPFGVAVDDSGNVYVADRSNNKIRKIIAR